MKLPIKKKYFDLINSGEKGFDLRDAHITFICEETGETFRRRIRAVNFIEASEVRMFYPDIDFEDDELLEFELERLKKV